MRCYVLSPQAAEAHLGPEALAKHAAAAAAGGAGSDGEGDEDGKETERNAEQVCGKMAGFLCI